jgi:hypothetical protein
MYLPTGRYQIGVCKFRDEEPSSRFGDAASRERRELARFRTIPPRGGRKLRLLQRLCGPAPCLSVIVKHNTFKHIIMSADPTLQELRKNDKALEGSCLAFCSSAMRFCRDPVQRPNRFNFP